MHGPKYVPCNHTHNPTQPRAHPRAPPRLEKGVAAHGALVEVYEEDAAGGGEGPRVRLEVDHDKAATKNREREGEREGNVQVSEVSKVRWPGRPISQSGRCWHRLTIKSATASAGPAVQH